MLRKQRKTRKDRRRRTSRRIRCCAKARICRCESRWPGEALGRSGAAAGCGKDGGRQVGLSAFPMTARRRQAEVAFMHG